MAKSKNNVVTHGMSGLVGDLLVFRQMANKTIVCGKPKLSKKPPHTAQLEVRERFKRASRYAKVALKDPLLKAAYQLAAKPGLSAYNMAFADYHKSPEFYEDIDLSTYTGALGDELIVSAIDDFKVKSVQVLIKAPDGVVIEEGFAVQAENELDWIYTISTVNAEVPGSQITFTAMDYPGNKTILEKVLD